MTVEDALVVVDAVLQHKRLNNVQELLFRQAWEGKTYHEIAEMSGYDASYIRDVGYKLWQTLSQLMGERVTKNNLQVVLRRYALRVSTTALQPPQLMVHGSMVMPYTSSIDLSNGATKGLTQQAKTGEAIAMSKIIDFKKATGSKQRDWGKATDTTNFLGRTAELEVGRRWIVEDRCRLVGMLGVGGVGKTTFTVKLAEQVQDEFDYLIWRSLRNVPPVEDLLVELIGFLSDEPPLLPAIARGGEGEVAASKESAAVVVDSLLSQLMHCLRTARCLIVLDGVESILRGGETVGYYCEGYEGYGELFRQVGEIRHQSCLLLSGREKPYELPPPQSPQVDCDYPTTVRSLQLQGLQEEARAIFAKSLSGTDESHQRLVAYYRGNPWMLKVASRFVRELFNGDIAQFLAHGSGAIGGIRHLLDWQYNRLSALERQTIYWLAIAQRTVSPTELWENIVPAVSRSRLLEALSSLCWRSLVEKRDAGFTLPPITAEYIAEKIIDRAYTAILDEKPDFLMRYALVQPHAEPAIRESQKQVLLEPLANKLVASLGTQQSLSDRLSQLLCQLRNPHVAAGYAMDNITALLHRLQIDSPGFDFAHLPIWQAYLQEIGSSFEHLGINFAPLLPLPLLPRANTVLAVTFSPDGTILASTNSDGTIKILHSDSGECFQTLQGHGKAIFSVVFSPDGRILASGSYDETIRIWDVQTGQCLTTISIQAPQSPI